MLWTFPKNDIENTYRMTAFFIGSKKGKRAYRYTGQQAVNPEC